MPYIPSPTSTLLSESTAGNKKPVDVGLIFLLVGVAIIAFLGFTGWYILAKHFRRRRLGETAQDASNLVLDVETHAKTESRSEFDCIGTKVVVDEVQFTNSLISSFKVGVYDSDSDDDVDESVLNTPTMDFDLEPRMKLSYVCVERSVYICPAIESMGSCPALVEEFSTPCEETDLSEPLIHAFKDAVYDTDACDFSTDSQLLSDTPVSDIEQVINIDIQKSIHKLDVLESIQSCQAVVEEWIVPIDLAQFAQPALEESPVQPEVLVLATAESTIVDQVRSTPLALSSRPSRTANSRRPGTSKAPRITGSRSLYSERSRASSTLVRTPARASSSIGQGTSTLTGTPVGNAPSTRPISSGTGTWTSPSSQPVGPSRALHRGSVPTMTGKIPTSKRALPAWRN